MFIGGPTPFVTYFIYFFRIQYIAYDVLHLRSLWKNFSTLSFFISNWFMSNYNPRMTFCWVTFRVQPFSTKQQSKLQIKEKWSFSFETNVKQLLNWQCTKFQLSQNHYWENFKITDHKYQFWVLKIVVFLAHTCWSNC